MSDNQPGKALERLVESLERALSENENVVVHAPLRLPDRTTKTLREFDVVLEVKEGEGTNVIVVPQRKK